MGRVLLALVWTTVCTAGLGARALAEEATRSTPRQSVVGFLEAGIDADYARAAEYLDLRPVPKASRQAQGPRLARQLKVVLDQKLWVDVEALSDEPEGQADDGLPARQDRVGEIEAEPEAVPILVERGRDGQWRIAAATVARVPELYAEFGYGPLGDYIPAPLRQIRFLHLELWQWLGLLVALLIAYAAAMLLSLVVTRAIGRLTAGTETELDDQLLRAAATPLTVTLAVALFPPATLPLGLVVPARETIAGLCRGLVVATIAWLGTRLVDAIAALSLLDNLGFDVTAVIAGLGIGGLAVALAAQKSFENFFGSVELSVDRPVAVGDFCRFGDQVGTVEDVGLRSVRMRTLDRTVITIPNSAFASMQLENFAVRDRIRFHTVLGLRYETTADQLRFALVELRKLLLAHSKVDADPARVRFVGFGSCSLDLEVYAYVRTSDWNEFLAVREDLLLHMMDVVESSGSGFAFPSQTVYLGRDDGLDDKRSRSAETRVREWREAGELPLPDPSAEAVAALDDTVPYPPEGSVSGVARRRSSAGVDAD
jgi:MscS family membrane protein